MTAQPPEPDEAPDEESCDISGHLDSIDFPDVVVSGNGAWDYGFSLNRSHFIGME